MRARHWSSILVAAALAVPLAASARGSSSGRGGRAAHPAVDSAASCEECHAGATPAPYLEWKNGAHGIALVKCFVCHGSTGADFTRKPAPDRCAGCHAGQVASMRAPAMKGKDCFTCHSPHPLDPHVTSPATSTAASLGADRLAPMVTVEGRIPPQAPATAPQAGAAPPAAGATSTPAAAPQAGAGAEKDVKSAQPHPPTDR